MILLDHFFEAEKASQLVFSEVGERRIQRDAVEPSEKTRFPLEAVDRLKRFDKSLLGKVRGILPIGRQIVDH
jgi:hypothetical protein